MLDETGFKRKTYADLMEEMEEKAKEGFGETINLSPRSFLGVLIRLFAWFLAIVWQVVEKVYNNSFPGSATGISLDRAVKFKGLTRNREDYAYGKIKIIGIPGETIEAGFVVGTKKNIYFETTEDVVLNEQGEGIVEIYAEETGSIGNVAAGNITEILNPNASVDSVINLEPTTGGRDRETDLELYARYQESPSDNSSSGIDSIQSTLLETQGVRDAIVSQNTSLNVVNGIPPKSIAPFVFGGTDGDVARAIFSVKAAGIESYGTTQIEVVDSKGNTHIIGFNRPTEIQVYVKVQLTKNSNFPADGLDIIRTNILAYIGGVDVNGNVYNGLGLNEIVTISRIISNSLIEGVDDVTVQLSTNGTTYSSSNISIASNQVAKTTHDKVVIT